MASGAKVFSVGALGFTGIFFTLAAFFTLVIAYFPMPWAVQLTRYVLGPSVNWLQLIDSARGFFGPTYFPYEVLSFGVAGGTTLTVSIFLSRKFHVRKREMAMLFVTLSVIALYLVPSFVAPIYASASSTQTAIGGQFQEEKPCTFYVFTDGTNYYAQNCDTGAIAYGGAGNAGGATGTSASSVIQNAIDGGGNGASIVLAGSITLTENAAGAVVTVDKTVNLQQVSGQITESYTSQAGTNYLFKVTSAGSVLNGLNVKFTNTTAVGTSTFIVDIQAANVVVKNSNFTNHITTANLLTGIGFDGSSTTHIIKSQATGNRITGLSGFILSYADDNLVSGNYIVNPTSTGQCLQLYKDAGGNTVSNNVCLANPFIGSSALGFVVGHASSNVGTANDNIFIGNTVANFYNDIYLNAKVAGNAFIGNILIDNLSATFNDAFYSSTNTTRTVITGGHIAILAAATDTHYGIDMSGVKDGAIIGVKIDALATGSNGIYFAGGSSSKGTVIIDQAVVNANTANSVGIRLGYINAGEVKENWVSATGNVGIDLGYGSSAVTGVLVEGNTVGTGTTRTFYIESGSSANIVIDNNFVSGTVTLSGSSDTVTGNGGYNPVGKITSPWTSTTVGLEGSRGQPHVSGTTYTITGVSLSFSCSGGGTVSITIKDGSGNAWAGANGATCATLSNAFVPVGPSSSYTITVNNSTAITMTVFGN